MLCLLPGWLLLMGEIAGLAMTTQDVVICLAGLVTYHTGSQSGAGGDGYTFSQAQMFGLYMLVLLTAALLNSLGTRISGWLTNSGAVFNVLVGVALVIALPAVAVKHQDAKFVFTSGAQTTALPSIG
jgi:amino acid transporter